MSSSCDKKARKETVANIIKKVAGFRYLPIPPLFNIIIFAEAARFFFQLLFFDLSIGNKLKHMKFRKAVREDVPLIVQLLANDKLGKLREDFRAPLPQIYYHAFEQINGDPNQELIVIENDVEEVIGTLQLSFIQYLTYQGGIRAQIEAVRIREDLRGEGIGQKLFEWAIKRAKEKKAHVLQLTTDKERPEAIKFYEKLGFKASHEGMKIHF